MRWLRLRLQEAGLGHFVAERIVVMAVVFIGVLGLGIARGTGVVALGIAACFLAMAMALELLVITARARHQALVEGLPQICEALAAAIQSGSNLEVSLMSVAVSAPKQVSRSMAVMAELLDKGIPVASALRWLKVELADVNSDQLIELLLASHLNGGHGLVGNLSRLSTQMRSEATLLAEIGAKQGWVVGTAKLALATPWLIVLLLSRRPENALAYNSAGGVVLLVVGLLICLFAYLLIQIFGALPQRKRVFA